MLLRQKTGCLGIDIGSQSIKLAQVKRTRGGDIRLQQAAIVERRTPLVDSDATLSETGSCCRAEVAAALEYLPTYSGRRSACTLPMRLFDLRGLNVPLGEVAERRAMIASELTDIWSESVECTQFDYWETDLPDKAPRRDEPNVNVLSLPADWSDMVSTDLEANGLHGEILDGPPLAIARAVRLVPDSMSAEVSAAIDWGFTSVLFCVVIDSRPVFTRRILGCGLRELRTRIEAILGVTSDEAQHLLRTCGLPLFRNDADESTVIGMAIEAAAAEILDRVLHELRRTLTFFSTQKRELFPEKIWLMGGGAAIKYAPVYLQENLGVSVDEWQLSETKMNLRSVQFPPALLAQAIALSAAPLMAYA